jgi:hypothetical protein
VRAVLDSFHFGDDAEGFVEVSPAARVALASQIRVSRSPVAVRGAGELLGGLAVEVARGEDAAELVAEGGFVDGSADGEEGGQVAVAAELVGQFLFEHDGVAASGAEVLVEAGVDDCGDVVGVQFPGGGEEAGGVVEAAAALEVDAPGVEGAGEVGGPMAWCR